MSDWKRHQVPGISDGPWANIERIGKWTWAVSTGSNGLRHSYRHVMGRRRAKAAAERDLAKLRIKLGYRGESEYLQ